VEETEKKHLGGSERRFISWRGGKDHLVERYPGNAARPDKDRMRVKRLG
jgi:hypothetical protein